MKNNKKGIGLIVTIVIIAVIAVVIATVLLIFNRDNNTAVDNNHANSGTEININNQNNTNNSVTDKNEEEKEWGITDRWTAEKGTSAPFYINQPKYRGYTEGRGLYSEHIDGTSTIVVGQHKNLTTIDNISTFFPTAFNDLEYTLQSIYGLLADNFKFSLENNRAVEINDYQMHMFEGYFEFDTEIKSMGKWQDVHRKYCFVAYATTLKSNGAYAYWVVYDTSEDQSKGELIKSHALNMAKSFREEQ